MRGKFSIKNCISYILIFFVLIYCCLLRFSYQSISNLFQSNQPVISSQYAPSSNNNSSSNKPENNVSTTNSSQTSTSSQQDTTSSVISSQNSSSNNSSFASSNTSSNETEAEENYFLNGLWISYYDLNLKNLSYDQFKVTIDKALDNAVSAGITDIFFHVRPNSDAFYPSTLFPFSSSLSDEQGKDPGYDPFGYVVTASHERNMKIHAWINPYRISSRTNDITTLSENNPAREWSESNSPNLQRCVVPWGNGLYYNPAKNEVISLIKSGVREILDNYPVDGIHFDDYFYPTSPVVTDDFDQIEYDEYCKNQLHPLSRDDWRRNNVNMLISGVYSVVKGYENVVFGVSPTCTISSDNTDKNYTVYFADVYKWMNSNQYLDYVIPQLYFGYEYPDDKFKFTTLLNQWVTISKHSDVKLYIGLGSYKIGKTDASSTEWQTDNNIIGNQVLDCFNGKTDGVVYYSYSSLFNQNDTNKANFEHLLSILQHIQ